MKLQKDVGTIDRVARIGLALALGIASIAGVVTAPVSYLLAVLAVVFFTTGAIGWCPIYFALGIRTCPIQRVDGRS
jgi:hypothetical protein